MLDNLYRRFTIWLGRQDIIFRYLGWNHKRVHRKRRKHGYQGLGNERQDD